MDITDQQELDEAVTQWRSQHGISEDDQVMVMAELVEIYAAHYGLLLKEEPEEPISFEECRGSIRDLKMASQEYARRSRELLAALRDGSDKPATKEGGGMFMIFAGCLIGLLGGFIAGKFYL